MTLTIFDNGVERELTEHELAEHAKNAELDQQIIIAKNEKAAARASAIAKLAGLGLTPEEIAALVGA